REPRAASPAAVAAPRAGSSQGADPWAMPRRGRAGGRWVGAGESSVIERFRRGWVWIARTSVTAVGDRPRDLPEPLVRGQPGWFTHSARRSAVRREPASAHWWRLSLIPGAWSGPDGVGRPASWPHACGQARDQAGKTTASAPGTVRPS